MRLSLHLILSDIDPKHTIVVTFLSKLFTGPYIRFNVLLSFTLWLFIIFYILMRVKKTMSLAQPHFLFL